MLARADRMRDADRFAMLHFLTTALRWFDIAQQRVPEEIGGFSVHVGAGC